MRSGDLSEHAAIVAEPFRLAHANAERERAAWRYETERRILQGFQLKQVCIVDSASLCLFAHNLTSGVVVNIGAYLPHPRHQAFVEKWVKPWVVEVVVSDYEAVPRVR